MNGRSSSCGHLIWETSDPCRFPEFKLNEAVKRNLARLPEDFMFRLTKKEWQELQALRS